MRVGIDKDSEAEDHKSSCLEESEMSDVAKVLKEVGPSRKSDGRMGSDG